MDTVILEQIKSSCPCFADKTDEELTVLIENLILMLSVSLCWDNGFLYQERSETFDYVNDNCFTCRPCERYKHYPLFYQSPEMDVLTVELITYNGLQETRYTLPDDTYTIRKGELLIDSAGLPRTCCTCSCEEFELNVTYNAGYKKLPERLVPIFCSLLTTISLSLLGCGSVEECCAMDKPKAYQIIKTKKVGEVSRTWTVDTTHVQYLYDKMFTENHLRLIAEMSLCNQLRLKERLWLVKSC